MTTFLLHDRLTQFLISLECLGTEGQRDAFANESIETGGTYLRPDDSPHTTHLFEIDLHGVSATGGSEREVVRNWKHAARHFVPVIDAEIAGLLMPDQTEGVA